MSYGRVVAILAALFLFLAGWITPHRCDDRSGKRRGLDIVRQGEHVWLMMYYSVRSIPKKMSRVTNYDVQYAGKSVFHIAFKASVLPSDTGTYSRYVSFIIPTTFQHGLYTFRATLRIGGRSATRSWRFAVSPTSATVAVDLTSQSGQTDKRFR